MLFGAAAWAGGFLRGAERLERVIGISPVGSAALLVLAGSGVFGGMAVLAVTSLAGPGHRAGRAFARHAHQARCAPGCHRPRVWHGVFRAGPGLRWPPWCLVRCSTGVRSAASSTARSWHWRWAWRQRRWWAGRWRRAGCGLDTPLDTGLRRAHDGDRLWSSRRGAWGSRNCRLADRRRSCAWSGRDGAALFRRPRRRRHRAPQQSLQRPLCAGDGSHARLPVLEAPLYTAQCERAHALTAWRQLPRSGTCRLPTLPLRRRDRSRYSSSSCRMDGSATPVSGCWRASAGHADGLYCARSTEPCAGAGGGIGGRCDGVAATCCPSAPPRVGAAIG